MAIDLPCILTRAVQMVLAAQDQPRRLERLFAQCPVPLVLVDQRERLVGANRPAGLALGLDRADLLSRRARDLVAPWGMSMYDAAWAQVSDGDDVALDRFPTRRGDGTTLDVAVQTVPEVLPGLRLSGFAPVGTKVGDLVHLTRRELELLQLAADGLSGPMIADELVLSRATVRTHFDNIYGKLDVHDRAGAVAKAMRLGLIV